MVFYSIRQQIKCIIRAGRARVRSLARSSPLPLQPPPVLHDFRKLVFIRDGGTVYWPCAPPPFHNTAAAAAESWSDRPRIRLRARVIITREAARANIASCTRRCILGIQSGWTLCETKNLTAVRINRYLYWSRRLLLLLYYTLPFLINTRRRVGTRQRRHRSGRAIGFLWARG